MDIVSFWKHVVAPYVRARVQAKSEVGASLVEYALLVALIAVVCIVSITFLGNVASSKLSEVGSAVSNG